MLKRWLLILIMSSLPVATVYAQFYAPQDGKFAEVVTLLSEGEALVDQINRLCQIRPKLDAIADGWAGIPAARLDWPASEPRYASALAHATHLLVTADSTNLLSEACATGRPVAVLGGETARGRRADLLESLREAGPLVDVDEWLDHGPVEPLREAPRVAESLRGLLGAR